MILDQYGTPIRAQDASSTGRTGTGRSAASVKREARLRNTRTGAGGASDKDVSSEIVAVALSRTQAERLYQMSWTMARLVDIIVDDMFAAGRRWTGDDEGANKAMESAEADLDFWTVLPDSLKAGRIFGSGILIICPSDGQWDKPFDPSKIKEGGIANLVSVDRWAMSVVNWQTDATKPRYGKPYQYRWSGRVFGSAEFRGEGPQDGPASGAGTTSQNVLLHSERCLRFDGVRSPLTEGWTSGPWQREWGVSIMTRALDEVMRDMSMSAASGHLAQEASVWVQKVHNFRDALARGAVEKGDVSPEDLAEEVNYLRSIYRTVFVDSQDDAERVDVAWSGLMDVLNYQFERIAAIEGIPVTRFRGTPATGMSATGEGEARDWRITVKALRKRSIDPILRRRLDIAIARHAGIGGDPPPWEWNELGDMTDIEAAELTFKRTEAVMLPFSAGVVDEDEVRERLSQDEWWGELGEWGGPTMHEQLEMERSDEKEEISRAEREQDKEADRKVREKEAGALAKAGPQANGKAGPPGARPNGARR